jgi:hypothetical protein
MDKSMEMEIKSVLDNLFSSIENKNIECAQSIGSLPAVKTAIERLKENDVGGFHLSLIYPFENMVDGLLAQETPQLHEAHFLIKQSEFVQWNFESLIIAVEGVSCSSDKSSTIINNLFKYLKSGTEIVFDYEQEYTYHLPSIIFKKHIEIFDFYKALRKLYYGKSADFIEISQIFQTKYIQN